MNPIKYIFYDKTSGILISLPFIYWRDWFLWNGLPNGFIRIISSMMSCMLISNPWPLRPAKPNWSYSVLFWGFDKTSYASATSLNSSSAIFFSSSVFPCCLSGCNAIAFLRYAFLISSLMNFYQLLALHNNLFFLPYIFL